MFLPEDFQSLMRRQLSADVAERLFHGLEEAPVVSIRLNPHKTSAEPGLEPVPWCVGGYYLPERPLFTLDPLLHAGVYYVQEASSMYLDEVLRQYMPCGDLVALDLCAAPGGKSTLLRSRLTEGSLLVSNEPVRQRAQVLAENMVKWGSPSCVVTQNVPDDFARFANTFDMVLADVPCSGEGMFRKEERAVAEWSLGNVDMCWRRQRGIVQDVWPALKPGGLLVYSTCTFNRFENEDNVEWLAGELGAEVLHQRRFFPGIDRGEGFFIATLRKHGTRRENAFPAPKPTRLNALSGDYVLLATPRSRIAIPAQHAELVARLRRTLCVISCGVAVEEARGSAWLPCHSLAMCTAYVRGTYCEVELSCEQAIAYLRRKALRLDAPQGVVLLTYRAHPIGFAKNIGNRANNLYPQEWRIRSARAFQPLSISQPSRVCVLDEKLMPTFTTGSP